MSKAILEFSLPEEDEEFELALRGRDANSVIAKLDDKLRATIKYEEVTDEVHKYAEGLRDFLNTECNARGVFIW